MMNRIGWKVIVALDLVVVAIFAAVMLSHDAPRWAIALLLYLETKPSRIRLMYDLRSVQTSVRAAVREAVDEADPVVRDGSGRPM